MTKEEQINDFKDDNSVARKGGSRKKVFIFGCLGTLVLIIITALIAFFSFAELLFLSPPNTDDIKKSVIKHKTLFEQAIAETKKLDNHITVIRYTSYEKMDDNPNYRGVYTGGVIGSKFVEKPIKNEVFEELFKQVKTFQGISIRADGIDFFGEGAGRNYYCGIVWTADGKPTGFKGPSSGLIPNETGWEYRGVNGDNWYYTERIVDNWFFYEAGF